MLLLLVVVLLLMMGLGMVRFIACSICLLLCCTM
jgi:hypothetical protein